MCVCVRVYVRVCVSDGKLALPACSFTDRSCIVYKLWSHVLCSKGVKKKHSM